MDVPRRKHLLRQFYCLCFTADMCSSKPVMSKFCIGCCWNMTQYIISVYVIWFSHHNSKEYLVNDPCHELSWIILEVFGDNALICMGNSFLMWYKWIFISNRMLDSVFMCRIFCYKEIILYSHNCGILTFLLFENCILIASVKTSLMRKFS